MCPRKGLTVSEEMGSLFTASTGFKGGGLVRIETLRERSLCYRKEPSVLREEILSRKKEADSERFR